MPPKRKHKHSELQYSPLELAQPNPKPAKAPKPSPEPPSAGEKGGGGGGGAAAAAAPSAADCEAKLDAARDEQLRDYANFRLFDTTLSEDANKAIKSKIAAFNAHLVSTGATDSVHSRSMAYDEFAPSVRELDRDAASAVFGFLFDVRAALAFRDAFPRDAPDSLSSLPSPAVIDCLEQLAARAANAAAAASDTDSDPVLAQEH